MDGYINREEFIQELILRERVRELVGEVQLEENKKNIKNNLARHRDIKKLRSLVAKIIVEAEEMAPHENTGINVLADLLKNIIPQLEKEYKLLTTDPEQRESFRAHIINATQNSLASSKAIDKAAGDAGLDMDMPLEEQEIDIDVKTGSEASDEDKFIDIDDKPAADVEGDEEEDTFGLEGEDQTGRNFAQRAFEKVEKQIIESYEMLSNEEDKQLFYDYLLTNLKLYFDKFEEELSSSIPEPTTDEYEEEVEAAEEEEPTADDTDLDLGGEDDEELDL
jgi:hypothetical protein